MEFIYFFRHRRYASLTGYVFFIGMMATGYYYNLTFVQFGLLDLGTRLVGLSEQAVARNMSALALVTALTAVLTGIWMQRTGLSRSLRAKLRLAFVMVSAQTVLTAVAPLVRSPGGFLAWVLAASLALGVSVPATFSTAIDLVPVRYRGFAGAWITALAYFAAAVFSTNWTIEQFSRDILPLMIGGTLGLGGLAFLRLPFMDTLAGQHLLPQYGIGRFVQVGPDGKTRIKRSLLVLFVIMFGIFFVDSLGFLRLASTPLLFETAWQSPALGPRLTIGVTHVLAALVAGLLYSALNEKELFLWIFGIFALVHLMYSFSARAPLARAGLSEPILYAVAVSLYTVVNFSIWADVSTPRTVSRNTAVGVALSAWTATFISTALALQMRLSGVPLELHLRIVDSLAILFFILVGALVFFSPAVRRKE